MPDQFGKGANTHRSTIVLVVLLVLSLACVTWYTREGEDGAIHGIQYAASGLVSPLKTVSGAISVGENRIASTIEDATVDQNSLAALREQNQELRKTVADLEEYRQEALRLEGLMEVKTRYNAQGIAARILSRSADAWNRVLTIDAGTADGVHAGLPVMASSGLIGQVVSTTDHTSDVRLIQDSLSGIAVIIQSSRKEGIVYGSLEGLLYLENLDPEAEVQAGDVVLTSGLGGGYYRGIMVGTILKVEGEAGATSRKIIVEPTGSNKPFEEVYVVTSMTSPYTEIDRAENGIVDRDGDGIPDEGSTQSYEEQNYVAGNYDDGAYYEEGSL